MVRILEKEAELTHYFPKNLYKNGTEFNLVLYSEVTHSSYSFSVVDSGQMPGYYSFKPNFSDVPDGEYVYRILLEERECSKGLICIGDYGHKKKIYSPSVEYGGYDATEKGFARYQTD